MKQHNILSILNYPVNPQEYISGKPPKSSKKQQIKLSSNESRFGISPKVYLHLLLNLQKLIPIYPDSSYQELKIALAEKNGVETGNIALGNGSDEIFEKLFLMFVKKGEKVITVEKTYTMYKILAGIVGAELKEVHRNPDFSFSVSDILSAIDNNTRLIAFCSPDNPTSFTLKNKEIEKLVESVPDNVLVIVDQAYHEFVNDKDYRFEDYWGVVSKKKNIVFTRTFSKLYGLAGLRVGYGIMHKELVKSYELFRMPFNINHLAYLSALYSLKDEKFYKSVLSKILDEREKLIRRLEELGLEVPVKGFGNFVFVNLNKRIKDVENFLKYLEREGISIRDLRSFGFEKGFVRITIGKPRENELLIKIIEKYLSEGNDEIQESSIRM